VAATESSKARTERLCASNENCRVQGQPYCVCMCVCVCVCLCVCGTILVFVIDCARLIKVRRSVMINKE
jgi:hypothetical protein